jgi:hypothetical protein
VHSVLVSSGGGGGAVREAAATKVFDSAGSILGTIGITVTLQQNAASESTHTTLIIDAVGPIVDSPPESDGGTCDQGTFPSTLAEASFDLGLLDGTARQIQVSFPPTTPLQAGEKIAFIFRVDPMSPDVAALTTDCAAGDGNLFVRSEGPATSGCLSNSPWMNNPMTDLQMFVTLNDGCDPNATITCGVGVCARRIGNVCHQPGTPFVCTPNACDNMPADAGGHPCALNAVEAYDPTNHNPPAPLTAGAGVCVIPPAPSAPLCQTDSDCSTGQVCDEGLCANLYEGSTPYGGVCTAIQETCNGFDDNCNGLTDEGLAATTCGAGTCETKVYNCNLASGNSEACTWPTGTIPAGEVCPTTGTPGSLPICKDFEPAGCP